MRRIRIIPRLDIKAPNLIKGVHLEGLRVLGEPSAFAKKYYESGADELLYMDTVASLYGRNSILEIIKSTASDIFIPLTVGGGIRSAENAKEALRAGADKIALNTAAIARPELISEIADNFGNQCVVVSIEAKQTAPGKWEAYTDNGREKTGIDVIDWVKKVQNLGAGEILITSVDMEGTKKGFDIKLIKAVCENAAIPVIASGGMGKIEHLEELIQTTNVDAVAIANVLHYNTLTLQQIREKFDRNKFELRTA